jgi:hypothetical protein
MRDSVSQGVCLPCSCTRDNEERHARIRIQLADTMFDGPSLSGLELVEIGNGHGESVSATLTPPRSRFVRNLENWRPALEKSQASVDFAAFGSTLQQSQGRSPAPDLKLDRRKTMRFMVIVKATKDSEAGKMPSEELLSAMAKFNEEMVKAGVMLDGNGLQPSSQGARVRFSGDKRTVIDGPFAETKELVAGYWILQCKSLAEAIEWIKRCPNPHNEDSEIEIRQLFDLDDFGTSEAVEHHRRLGEQIAAKH